MAVFKGAVHGVGAAPEGQRYGAGCRVSELGGHAGSDDLDFFQRIRGGLEHLVVLVEGFQTGPFGADAIHGITDGTLNAAQDVIARRAVAVHVGYEVQGADNAFLNVALVLKELLRQHGRFFRRFGFQQRRLSGDDDVLAYRADLQVGVEARRLAGSQSEAFPDPLLESVRGNDDAVRPRIQVGNVVISFCVGGALGFELGTRIDNGYLGARHRRAAGVPYGSDNRALRAGLCLRNSGAHDG